MKLKKNGKIKVEKGVEGTSTAFKDLSAVVAAKDNLKSHGRKCTTWRIEVALAFVVAEDAEHLRGIERKDWLAFIKGHQRTVVAEPTQFTITR